MNASNKEDPVEYETEPFSQHAQRDNTMIDKTTMTVAGLLVALDCEDPHSHPDDVCEVLPKILYAAGSFYDDRDAADGYAMSCCFTLCLAAYLVRADGIIDEKVANGIIDSLGDIAAFALEADGLSSDTRARLEQIKHAAEPVGASHD